MEQYFQSQRDHIFKNVEVLIYVFDVTSKDFKGHDMTQFENSLNALHELSPNTRIFCLIHKMDLLNVNLRESTFQQRKQDIEEKVAGRFVVDCFKTSIWDETLYGAWSKIVSFLLPNIKECQLKLKALCETMNADEVILFERSTFLVIAHHDTRNHSDVHRFEKISNIIKQFKLSCIKTSYKFDSMVVRNEKFSAFVEGFTNSTYIMVVTSDESISYEAI
jgi:Ras-related GTP-binding protein A/B